jgi:GT2 family glycosyltransferase
LIDVTVAIASHDRPVRLRWLLNALEEQTLDPDRWELVVATTNEELARIATEHPVGARHVHPHASGPAAQRNAGWRAARAPLVLFTDDDCRPAPDWVEKMLAAGRAHPGAIVQGAVRADPYEWSVGSSPHARTLVVKPPNEYAQTANILYPRDVLERLDGFDEAFPGPAGEDLDLAERAWAAGVPYEGEPDGLVWHAVEAYSLPQAIRLARKWTAVPYLVKLHPHIRRTHGYQLGIFWRASHFRWLLAALGLVLGRRRPALRLLAVPYVTIRLTRRGVDRRALAAGLLELPGQAIVDGAEVVTIVKGSVEHRTLLL